ncbi:MAG: N-acetyltransferase [Thermodesulfobacteriota bacterium]|nr:N-acetyltransferase [Thermodesulfobacteriota bacterium]
MHIRKAVAGDIRAIHGIVNHYADQGLMLPRPLSELYDHLRDYFVSSAQPGRKGLDVNIHGVCGLGICWEDLAEIKSLAVSRSHQGGGLGSQLVGKCLEEARLLGLTKVFTLTYIPHFFVRLGFKEVDKSLLPQKIWADCLKCPKFPGCDETALMIEL